MLRVNQKTLQIDVTRGDDATFELTIPLRDENDYIKYSDNENNIYWYDEKESILYDDEYERSIKKVKDLELQLYKFEENEKVRFKVFKKKDCSSVVLEKEFETKMGATSVDIVLTNEDTKIGEVISADVNYWYEIELVGADNTIQTIIGYDVEKDTGKVNEKIFKLLPEGQRGEE